MPMVTVALTFPFINEDRGGLNTSLQVGDIIYYCPDTPHVNFNIANITDIIEFGVVTAIFDFGTINVRYDDSIVVPPSDTDFIMFGKNKTINTSSLVGYYADVNFVNNSTEKAELFSVGSEIFESSK
jgi:hypothetical protein